MRFGELSQFSVFERCWISELARFLSKLLTRRPPVRGICQFFAVNLETRKTNKAYQWEISLETKSNMKLKSGIPSHESMPIISSNF